MRLPTWVSGALTPLEPPYFLLWRLSRNVSQASLLPEYIYIYIYRVVHAESASEPRLVPKNIKLEILTQIKKFEKK